LWKALEVLGTIAVDERPLQVLVYTVDAPSPDYHRQLLADVQQRFSIALSDKLKIRFVHLHAHRHLLQPSPYLSLVLESLGALRLAWIGLQQSQRDGLAPHVFVDTTGCAFTFVPAVLCFACRVVAYVHYPTISTDMLRATVWERRREAYGTPASGRNSRNTTTLQRLVRFLQTTLKLLYYVAFAMGYGAVGSLATLVMVNSTWTYRHIAFLWKGPAWRRAIHIVYPPCAVADLASSSSAATNDATATTRQPPGLIVSIGQFRPEKDHVLQIEALRRLLERHPDLRPTVRLKLVGSCRHDDDRARLAALQSMVHQWQLDEQVEFDVNVPYAAIKACLTTQASVGIHTMWNEHFGIGIVEMMAAGLLVVAHNSGGPRSDIVTPGQTGFLAATVDEYADALYQALTLPPTEATRMRQAAQTSAQRFSDQVFAASFRQALSQAKLL
jgi:alpha-1,2-mannosyltransferase